MTTASRKNPTRHDKYVVRKPPMQRPHRRRDRRRRPHQRVRLTPSRPIEIAVDQRLHRRQQQRRPQTTHDRPEDDDRSHALRDSHRQRPHRIAQQPHHIGPLTPEQITELAADQDERRRHQGLERDRRLHTGHIGAQILDHRRDRHIHQRRIDHQHEHRHREQQREARITHSLFLFRRTGPPRRNSSARIYGHKNIRSSPRGSCFATHSRFPPIPTPRCC